MQLLIHPDAKDITLEGVFYALADKARLQIVKTLYATGGKPLSCLHAVEGLDDMAVSTRSHHFRILRDAGLVWTEKDGREARNTLRLGELESRFPGLLKNVVKHIPD